MPLAPINSFRPVPLPPAKPQIVAKPQAPSTLSNALSVIRNASAQAVPVAPPKPAPMPPPKPAPMPPPKPAKVAPPPPPKPVTTTPAPAPELESEPKLMKPATMGRFAMVGVDLKEPPTSYRQLLAAIKTSVSPEIFAKLEKKLHRINLDAAPTPSKTNEIIAKLARESGGKAWLDHCLRAHGGERVKSFSQTKFLGGSTTLKDGVCWSLSTAWLASKCIGYDFFADLQCAEGREQVLNMALQHMTGQYESIADNMALLGLNYVAPVDGVSHQLEGNGLYLMSLKAKSKGEFGHATAVMINHESKTYLYFDPNHGEFALPSLEALELFIKDLHFIADPDLERAVVGSKFTLGQSAVVASPATIDALKTSDLRLARSVRAPSIASLETLASDLAQENPLPAPAEALLSENLARLNEVIRLLEVLHTEEPEAGNAALKQTDEIGRSLWVQTEHALDQQLPEVTRPLDRILKLQLELLRTARLPARAKFELLRDPSNLAERILDGIKARLDPGTYAPALSYGFLSSQPTLMSYEFHNLIVDSIKDNRTPLAGVTYARLLAQMASEDASLQPAVRRIVKELMQQGRLLALSKVGVVIAEIFELHGLLSEDKSAKLAQYKAQLPQRRSGESSASSEALNYDALRAEGEEIRQFMTDYAKPFAAAHLQQARLREKQHQDAARTQAEGISAVRETMDHALAPIRFVAENYPELEAQAIAKGQQKRAEIAAAAQAQWAEMMANQGSKRESTEGVWAIPELLGAIGDVNRVVNWTSHITSDVIARRLERASYVQATPNRPIEKVRPTEKEPSMAEIQAKVQEAMNWGDAALAEVAKNDAKTLSKYGYSSQREMEADVRRMAAALSRTNDRISSAIASLGKTAKTSSSLVLPNVPNTPIGHTESARARKPLLAS